ncbi:MAG: hypothetical protein WC897_00230 [Candidatus Gracilibacteria bacterium]
MRKEFLVFTMAMSIVVFSAGCKIQSPFVTDAPGGVDADAGEEDVEVGGDLSDLMEAQQKITETYDENDPEAVAKMMEAYAEYGAQVELDEFKNTEAVDAPIGFPPSLIYDNGKVTSASDSTEENYIYESITIETTDDLKTVKAFYKNLFSESYWRLTSQSSESDSASYDATDSANIDTYVYIYADPYSKLVSIDITYSGYLEE